MTGAGLGARRQIHAIQVPTVGCLRMSLDPATTIAINRILGAIALVVGLAVILRGGLWVHHKLGVRGQK
jgi:hypothetical protein